MAEVYNAKVETLIKQVPKPKLNEFNESGLVTLEQIQQDILIEQVNFFFKVETKSFKEAVDILETMSETRTDLELLSFLIYLNSKLIDTNLENNQELIHRNNMIYKFAYDTIMSASGFSGGRGHTRRPKTNRRRRKITHRRRRHRKSTRRRRRKH
jgi:hypothetical protein